MLLFLFGLEYEGNLENLRFSDKFFSAIQHRRFLAKNEKLTARNLSDPILTAPRVTEPQGVRSIPILIREHIVLLFLFCFRKAKDFL